MVNADVLANELDWLKRVIDLRFHLYFHSNDALRDKALDQYGTVQEMLPPQLEPSDYAVAVQELGLGFEERLMLALCIAVHVRPQLLDVFFNINGNLPTKL